MSNCIENPQTTQELNNIYFVDAGWHRMDVEYIPDVGTIREEVYCCGLYCAPSRGKVRSLFIEAYHHDFEWTETMSIRCVAKGIMSPVGEAPYNAWLFNDPSFRSLPLVRLALKEKRAPTDQEYEYLVDAHCKMQPGINRGW